MASLAVKQSSYVLKCFRCFLSGMPSWRLLTMLFHSLVALQGPSSTKLLSISILNNWRKKTVGCFLSYFILQLAPPTVKHENKFRRARAGVFKFKRRRRSCGWLPACRGNAAAAGFWSRLGRGRTRLGHSDFGPYRRGAEVDSHIRPNMCLRPADARILA